MKRGTVCIVGAGVGLGLVSALQAAEFKVVTAEGVDVEKINELPDPIPMAPPPPVPIARQYGYEMHPRQHRRKGRNRRRW